MLVDVLALIHLVLYPMLTGMLVVGVLVSLVQGNRWVLLAGPALVFMTLLTIDTHLNYLSYM
jgi:cytochrome b561